MTTDPVDHGLPGHGWTLKKLRAWLSRTWNRTVSRSTLHAALHAAKMSWKRCCKLLGKRNPEKRAAFLERFHKLYEQTANQEVMLIYIDESHFHRDVASGFTWGRVGERIWRISACAPLSDRINWYGAYNFSDGQCLIWAEGACNSDATIAFLKKVSAWVPADGRRVVVIWDGAPWHRARRVARAAAELGLELVPLPGYSPDLNPIEGLWKWMREEVTQLTCYGSVRELFDACKRFVEAINRSPLDLIQRLWPRFELDPAVEKLQISG